MHGKTRKVVRKTTKTVAEPLIMPTAFVGQNGATFSQLAAHPVRRRAPACRTVVIRAPAGSARAACKTEGTGTLQVICGYNESTYNLI